MSPAEFQALEPTSARYNTPDNYHKLVAAVAAWSSDHYVLNEATTFRIVFARLKDNVIRLNPSFKEPIPTDFQRTIDAMSSTQLRERLQKDRVFADFFGRWSAGEKPAGATAADDPYANFSAHDWKTTRPEQLCRLMADPRFKKRVDALIAAGLI